MVQNEFHHPFVKPHCASRETSLAPTGIRPPDHPVHSEVIRELEAYVSAVFHVCFVEFLEISCNESIF